jgi:acyl carrier protein
VRAVLAEHAGLAVDVAALDSSADLYKAGMTSHATVNVMLALEDEFEVEFPTEMLSRGTFESVSAISAALGRLGA